MRISDWSSDVCSSDLPPSPGAISELGYYDLHVIGVEKKRADAIKRVATHAPRLQAAATLPAAELRARLEAIPAIGQWTSAEVSRVVVVDADAAGVGPFHLKNTVAWALASQPQGSHSRMPAPPQPLPGPPGRACR